MALETTMDRTAIANGLIDAGVVAIIRMQQVDRLLEVVRALHAGGLVAIEITMSVPGALRHIEAAADALGDRMLLGVGSVLDAQTVRDATAAGARYVVSPVFKPEVIRAAHAAGVPALPGAFSPTEILLAQEAGADLVKVFPADLGGIAYLRSLLAPMPHLRLMPTGGVDLQNADAWLRAGAKAVGMGSALLDKQAIDEGRYDVLTERARGLLRRLRAVREEQKALAATGTGP
jgi:2-dehydro-3-deoxyphosphogluconate aldolase/(4S)-4-hydroxy-2-oxoglutarate aldolase